MAFFFFWHLCLCPPLKSVDYLGLPVAHPSIHPAEVVSCSLKEVRSTQKHTKKYKNNKHKNIQETQNPSLFGGRRHRCQYEEQVSDEEEDAEALAARAEAGDEEGAHSCWFRV